MFEKRHRNRVKLIRSVSASSLLSEDGGVATPTGTGRGGHENSHHERVRILASSPGMAPSRDDDTIMSVGGGSSVGGGDESIGLWADVRHRDHTRPLNKHYRDSRTLPNFAMESVSHDQMPFAYGEVRSTFCPRFHLSFISLNLSSIRRFYPF